jgi:hypothetical protein
MQCKMFDSRYTPVCDVELSSPIGDGVIALALYGEHIEAVVNGVDLGKEFELKGYIQSLETSIHIPKFQKTECHLGGDLKRYISTCGIAGWPRNKSWSQRLDPRRP